MANAFGNMEGSSDGPDNVPMANADALFEDLPKEMLRLFKEAEKYVNSISKTWKDAIKDTKGFAGDINKDQPGSGKLGLASITRFAKQNPGTALGLATVGVAQLAMAMAPNTMDAVNQRVSADTFAGLSGMSSRQAILGANKAVGGGVTSAYSPTMATMNLFYQGGYSANSKSSQGIMSQLAGMSAMSGMTNEQAASSVAGMNGMSFLRMGVSIRDTKGNLKPPNQMIDDVYRFLYRGQKITKEQAALVYNPGSKGYQSLMAVSNGDQGLMQMLQAGIVARASAGSDTKFNSAMTSKDPNNMWNAMGVDQSSPLRANARFQTSQNKALAATEKGLVGGYDASLRTSAALTSGMSDLANALPGVTQALMTFKGALQTFPNAGNVGGAVSGLLGTAGGLGVGAMQLKMMSKFMAANAPAEAAIGPALESGAFLSAGLAEKTGLLAKLGGGKALMKGGLMVAGSQIAGSVLQGHSSKGSLRHRAGNAAKWAGIMAAIPGLGETILPEIIAGGIGYATGGGHEGVGTSSTSGSSLGYASPVPTGTPVTSPYGPRATHGNKHMSANHKGLDYGVKHGTPITSIKEGVVKEIGNGGGWGNFVVVLHPDGTTSRYAHLSKILVSRGQKVAANTVVGHSGGTPGTPGAGSSTGPHLHLEVKDKSNAYLNPATVLSGATASNPSATVTDGKKAITSNSRATSGGSQTNSIQSLGQLSSPDLNSIISSMGMKGAGKSSNLFGEGVSKNLGNNKALSWASGKTQVTPGIILGTGSSQGWAKTLLGKLGMPDTPANVQAMTTWAAWEGGQWHNTAHYNPLNTTQVYDGSVAMNNLGHGMGVQSYKTWEDGYTATIQTLNNGRYKNILSAMKKGTDSAAVLKAVNRSPWGTHIPNAGGGPAGVDVSSTAHSPSHGYSGSSGSFNASSQVNVTLKMDVKIASSSVGDAERMVQYVGKRLKEELGLGSHQAHSIKSIASLG